MSQCVICKSYSNLHKVNPTTFICESCLSKATPQNIPQKQPTYGVVVKASYPREITKTLILEQIQNIECEGIELLRWSFDGGIMKLDYQCSGEGLIQLSRLFLEYISEVQRQIEGLHLGKIEIFEV